MDIRFDQYYDNHDLHARLAHLAAEHAGIVSLGTLGQSFEGRDIPLVTVTNRDTGPDLEKPAFWIDANIHATEVTGAMAALYVLHALVTRYGRDPVVTRIIDEQVVYIAPCLKFTLIKSWN